MQNESFLDGVQSTKISPQTGATTPIEETGGTFEVPPVPPPRTFPTAAAPEQAVATPAVTSTPVAKRIGKRWQWIAVAAGVAVLLIVGAVIVWLTRSNNPSQIKTGSYGSVTLPLDDLDLPVVSASNSARSLKVNGVLGVSSSVVMTPTTRPQNPVLGQMYFDQTLNQLMYYNGQQFVGAGANQAGATNITNSSSSTTNIFNTLGGGAPPSVELQASSPGIQQAGNFNITGTGQAGALKTASISSLGGNLDIQSTADVSLMTAASSSATGGITIKTGDSSTTASGNIILDTGTGIIDGEVVEDKTFESGLDDMQDWFNTSIATSTEQAHSGSQSLKMTPSSNFWGIIEILPGTPVTPGHQYHFSMWVRAESIGSTVGGAVVWPGSGGAATSFTSAVDNTTGWTELSLTAPAPAGATSVYFQIQSNSGTAGAAHYFDDITITDLSSSSAFSSIDIGTTNAKVITIGNMNQIGATSIMSSSGVTINGGAGNLTMTGGTVNLTGNGASTIKTTTGALTIISAGPADWGVGTSTTGAGDSLTLHGGAGAFGNNDGGDLVLQGGSKTGTGIGGSVIVKAQSDAVDTFQVQNAAGTSLFTIDTSGLVLTVAGSDTSFVKLTLANAHFGSTQTTPPTISVPTNCGTGPAATVNADSTDNAGSFSITTGLGGTSSSCDATITFHQPFGAAPKSIIVVGNSDALSVARQIYVSSSNATTFTVRFATSAGGADNQFYSFNYWVVE